MGAEGGYVYVKRTAPMDKRQFRRYLETCRRLSFRFDRGGGSSWWLSLLDVAATEPDRVAPYRERIRQVGEMLLKI